MLKMENDMWFNQPRTVCLNTANHHRSAEMAALVRVRVRVIISECRLS